MENDNRSTAIARHDPVFIRKVTDLGPTFADVTKFSLEPIVEVAVAPAPPVIEQAMESMNSKAAAPTPIEAAEPTSVANPTVPDLAPESVALEAAISLEESAGAGSRSRPGAHNYSLQHAGGC